MFLIGGMIMIIMLYTVANYGILYQVFQSLSKIEQALTKEEKRDE